MQTVDGQTVAGEFLDAQADSVDRQQRPRSSLTACQSLPSLYRQYRQTSCQPHAILFPQSILQALGGLQIVRIAKIDDATFDDHDAFFIASRQSCAEQLAQPD